MDTADKETTCAVYPELTANVSVTYGLYEYRDYQTLNLSFKASRELWDRSKELVNLGLMHWINRPIER
jgi:hypothetical protein